MKFSYKKVSILPLGSTVLRPIVPLQVFGRTRNWKGVALVDSGADRSLFDIEVARYIGLDLSKGKKEKFGGIGKDQVQVYTVDVEIQLIGMDERVKIPIGFMENSNIRGLLGQEGFFDAFKITFDRKNDIIDIK